MKAVLPTIRILVITLLVNVIRCQDGYSDRDLLRFQQLAANESPAETITSYGSSIIQRDPGTQSISSVSHQYHMTDDEKSEDYNRADRGRTRKVYRIKNPFQRPMEDDNRQESQPAQDSDTGASNQYAAMQYSLPPEEFLRQMRAENQYFQQQQQQVSTQAPNLGYTATPQPQYQYSTISASGYDNSNQPSNQAPQLEPKISQAQDYRSFANSYQSSSSNAYQYGNPNSYVESVQSTPAPIQSYVSTANNPYVGTPANAYVSSSAPIYLSSPANVQYISSSISNIPAGTPDYKITSTLGSNSINYDTQEINKKMQIDHYDNGNNGMRYPSNIHQQYQNDYPSSTPSPSSTPYPDPARDSWQNNINSNSYPKSLQDYQKFSYYRNQQDTRQESPDYSNTETHRVGNNVPSANNVYLNFVQPDYQALANIRARTREIEQETPQQEYYSHGEYGWKLSDKKPLITQSGYSSTNFPRYQTASPQSDGVAVSQMSFHMDTGKQHHYDHISKSSQESIDAQEFAKAAAKAHENMKQRQQYYLDYSQNYNSNTPSHNANAYYSNNNEKQRNKMYSDSSSANPFTYNNSPQPDLITASPYYFQSSRENNLEEKPKQPFDHDKALKNIVPIDVSNVVAENQQKQGLEGNTRYTISSNYNKEQLDQIRQNFKSITDAFYQDKNSAYGINIKPRPDESSDGLKLAESSSPYFMKQPVQDQYYQSPYGDNKRYPDSVPSPATYLSQTNSYTDSVQSSANLQQQGLQRPQNQGPSDISSILKLNDIPYRLTQNLPPETFRLNNGNYEPVGLPTPLPMRLNQNVGTHQIDVANTILNKILSKQPTITINRPEIDPSALSTVNGFKVANPYNIDLKLVAEMLKGKPVVDDSHMINLRDQLYNKPSPIRLDYGQLQNFLLQKDNNINLGALDGLSAYTNPFLDLYGNGRFPYQGVKYSRSQEEEETVMPIADASNTHPIGAVIEQDDPTNGREGTGTELNTQDEDTVSVNFGEDNKQKHSYPPGHRPNRHRHPNSIFTRPPFPRKYPKADMGEPYPLLKPPPSRNSRGRSTPNKSEKNSRRRRVRRPKVIRLIKSQTMYENEEEDNSEVVPILLRPPPPVAEAKSDGGETEPSS